MKLGFFITARLKSSRLKRKILLDLNGKTILERVIERACATRHIDGVVLCTSSEKEDAELTEIAVKNGIDYYCGSADDVLDRLMNAAIAKKFDAFLSITADNPLFSIKTSDYIARWIKEEPMDFIATKGLPMGCATYAVDCKALQIVRMMKKESESEIWGPYIHRPDFFNVGELHVMNSPFKEEIRITCDYPEDYELFRKIYSYFQPAQIPDLAEVLRILSKEREILKINSMHTQRMLDKETLEKINQTFQNDREKGLNYAKKINKELKAGLSIREFYLDL